MNRFRTLAEKFSRFGRDRKGVAAIEFAFVAPVLLVLYMMTMEISQAIDTNKKVGRIASLIADLATQEQDITKAEIDAIMEIGDSMLQPYNRSQPVIEIDAISIDATAKPTIAWSRKYASGTFSANKAVGTLATVPVKLKIADTFLVNVRTSLAYSPVISWVTYKGVSSSGGNGWTSSVDALNMGQEYFLRPRIAATVNCTDC